MAFGKPFRAAPVRLGPYYREQKRRRSLLFAAKVLGGAAAFGLAAGALSTEKGRAQVTYYPNCDAARAAGAAPILEGEPGYRPELDADDDGIACEPYRGY